MSNMHQDQNHIDILKHVIALSAALPPKEAALLEQFIQIYYKRVSAEDLAVRTAADLYGAAFSHWKLLCQRREKESVVQVYNPQLDKDGWQSPHTVIAIAHDDMAFLMDSIRAELTRQGYYVYLMVYVSGITLVRDTDGQVLRIEENSQMGQDAAVYIEINRQSDESILKNIIESINVILEDVRNSGADYHKMTDMVDTIIASLSQAPATIPGTELEESRLFLEWLKANNFTFLGYYQLKIAKDGDDTVLEMCSGTGLGVLKNKNSGVSYRFSEVSKEAQHILSDPTPVIFIGKTSTISTVHRSVFTDYISIKQYNAEGAVIGHHKFVGLYTSSAYNSDPQLIPLIRHKIDLMLVRANANADSHDGRDFLDVLKRIPRDDLFQATKSELYDWAKGILYLQERSQVRFFMRKDVLGSYYSCLVYIPREKFNSVLREKIQYFLQDALNASHSYFFTYFSESVLARIHFILRAPKGSVPIEDNAHVLEKRISEISLTWNEELSFSLREYFGDEKYHYLHKKFHDSFPAGYREDFSARLASHDIQYMEELSEEKTLSMSFYRPEGSSDLLRFKIFQSDNSIPLSEVVPMLENLGLDVISERPYTISLKKGRSIWINDFCMRYSGKDSFDVELVKEIFQDAFYNIWHENAESDGFNRLVLSAGLSWREVSIFRAYSRYLWQIGFAFSQSYVESSLYEHPHITKKLIQLFFMRFDPSLTELERDAEAIIAEIKADLENVESLDQDRILNRFLDIILATVRTNFFQKEDDGRFKAYVSFKFNPAKVPDLPLPAPMFEIFVYSPTVEGVHLRTASIARGGLRWSDRREDFRTEILGLVKAQRVKNSVIVPMGAKGGFYPKCPPISQGRDAILQNGIACYKTFIRGLLDLTDNLVDNGVVPPQDVVRYDSDDYYLVVAADKGTATFSDIANSISEERGFWLGDAFASGGSAGYDHKKMGITAKGAWEAVKRHFIDINFDCQSQDFSVIGIGDMAGDVFGNGMLLSKHIRLLGAFNHIHIFIDPMPDPSVSFEERSRLFNLPRSQWSDYEPARISKGGGVFLRTAKAIPVSPEMREVFGITKDSIEPNELIRTLLCSKVDLLWNGGIGTWVKASYESHAAVGDRANDALRVNADQLRCKVVGEGGNLGFTQLGRVEYALNGGRINTDAIDNSGGVNCSDHEVNIKILLNELVASGDMTGEERNKLLIEMTEEVSELVLESNRKQPDAISMALYQAPSSLDMHSHLISNLEKVAGLVCSLEFLPDKEGILKRKAANQGLTRPEIAVMMAYTKIFLKEEMLKSDLMDDPYVRQYLISAFPSILVEKYEPVMQKHRLRREIIATQLSNCLVNEVGINFVQRLQDETGASVPDIVRGYLVAREVFQLERLRGEIEKLGCAVNSNTQSKMVYEMNRLMRRAARWFLRNRKKYPDMEKAFAHFDPKIREIFKLLPQVFVDMQVPIIQSAYSYYVTNGVPEDLANEVATFSGLFPALDMIAASTDENIALEAFIPMYYQVGAALDLEWFREDIDRSPVKNHWDALARAAFRDSLDSKQRDIAVDVMHIAGDNMQDKMAGWEAVNQLAMVRWKQMIAELKSAPVRDFTMYSVVLRELMDMGA